MKKYTSVAVCVILLICTIFLLPTNAKSGVEIGKGNGKSEQINSIADLLGMLSCIQSGNYDGTIGVNDDILNTEDKEALVASLISFSTSSDNDESEASKAPKRVPPTSKKAKADEQETDEDEKKITEYDFDSFTVHEYAHMAYNEGTKDTSTMNRELSIYIDGKNTYYHSKGQITSEYDTTDDDGDIEHHTTFTDFDMEFFINSKKNKVYMKVNHFYMVAEETVCFSSKIIGRWVHIDSDDFLDSFLSVNDNNLSALSDLSSAIKRAYEDGELKNKTKTQNLDKDDLGKIYDENYERFDIRVDLSDTDSPTISMVTSISGGGGLSVSYDLQMEATYTFENIDNTEVSMKSNVDILKIDEDDIEDYIWTE